MATVAHGTTGTAFRPSFHLWMTLLMAFFVFGGFGMTYIGPLISGKFPPAPPVVHLHGIVFFSWTALLVIQSVLVNTHNVRLHRSLGTFGIALAAIVAFVGMLIAILGCSNPPPDPNPDPTGGGLAYLSLVVPPSFAVLFAMAIRAVRTPAVHRSLILLAMVSMLMPGINRFYMMSLGLGRVPHLATFLTMDAMLAAVLYHERRAAGRISRATSIAAAIIVVPQPLMWLVAPTPQFAALTQYLGSLVYYR